MLWVPAYTILSSSIGKNYLNVAEVFCSIWINDIWNYNILFPCRRPRIDRSQIGQPMNFRHTGHVGSSDLGYVSRILYIHIGIFLTNRQFLTLFILSLQWLYSHDNLQNMDTWVLTNEASFTVSQSFSFTTQHWCFTFIMFCKDYFALALNPPTATCQLNRIQWSKDPDLTEFCSTKGCKLAV